MHDAPAAELIRCSALSKSFRQYAKPSDRLLDDLSHAWPRWLGGRPRNSANEFHALRGIDLTLNAGEAVAIIGRNGSGKSTLLQLIAGTLSPGGGAVQVHGRVCAMLELGVGFNPEFTGLENVRLYAAVLGMSSQAIEQRLPSIIAFAEIGDFVDQPVKTYSSGMYVRLAFAVLAHSDPELLIVDEALSVGDAAFQAKCMHWFRNFQEAGGSLLLVSHDVATVRAICSRAIYLESGRIKAEGPCGEVTDLYLHDIHQTQNQVLAQPAAPSEGTASICQVTDAAYLARCQAFEQRWISRRQGTGDSRVRLVELLDASGEPSELFQFDAPAIVRIHVECLRSAAVSVNYKVRDRHLVSVIGADFLIAEQPLLTMQPGEIHCIEYRTRLPLMHGDYSLRLSISEPVDKHAQAVFHDIVEVALPFKVLPADRGWIYTQSYLPNQVSVRQWQDQTQLENA
ncbi:ABC transporter ATP-binding protein [Pseudomonas nitroreducens]|uniref:ABC transporter ATP-binding protein n=1 Tax=Pseudomonas nitroreducens TaxID=46680 RepID=UPI00209DD1CE|nr:ABC transporter ATP-binding protein [Pseudomonas nitroreducens]MCP1625615.1 lipopolysaccharide transport system ATP-binding protein [Pseudomonas nitroreducens]